MVALAAMPVLAPARPPVGPTTLDYRPVGAAREAFHRHDPELILDGPAGTGKTRGLLEKVHLCAQKYPGMRGLLLRRVFEDLKGSAMVTFREKVLHPTDGVQFFGGSAERDAGYYYPNRSFVGIGGFDRPTKVMSKEYDLVYVNEATELTEDQWEKITSRLRYGVMPYQQLLADCNPDSPTHWLKQRADRGQAVMLPSRHEDNPSLWDAQRGEWTERGRAYIAKLDALTGVRRERLRRGRWVQAEGAIYAFDRAVHLIDPFPIPADWPRYWVLDFGYVNPFVWLWAAEGPDGDLIVYREIYMTGRLVADHARQGLALSGNEPRPVAIITDHDAEDRATFERETGLTTTPAPKEVSPGIQMVQQRLRASDGRPPRLRFFRTGDLDGGRYGLIERDPALAERGKPCSTVEEFGGYVWDTSQGRRKGEQPVKADDHGMDTVRYLTAWREQGLRGELFF